jgi:hypothetical protein
MGSVSILYSFSKCTAFDFYDRTLTSLVVDEILQIKVHNDICVFEQISELSVKSSKESTEPVSLLKTGNKVVEVG